MQRLWFLMRCGADLTACLILMGMCPLDLREHEIDGRSLAGLAVTSFWSCICFEMEKGGLTEMSAPFMMLCMSLLPGLFMMIVSLLSSGQLGLGDALLFLALGFRMDPVRVVLIGETSFLPAIGWGILRRLRSGRWEELPLVPCTAAAAGAYLLEEAGLLS